MVHPVRTGGGAFLVLLVVSTLAASLSAQEPITRVSLRVKTSFAQAPGGTNGGEPNRVLLRARPTAPQNREPTHLRLSASVATPRAPSEPCLDCVTHIPIRVQRGNTEPPRPLCLHL